MRTDSSSVFRQILRSSLLCVALGATAQNVSGYELATHGLLTYQAFATSDLRPGTSLYRILGVEVYIATTDPEERKIPFGAAFYDFNASDARLRISGCYGSRRQALRQDQDGKHSASRCQHRVFSERRQLTSAGVAHSWCDSRR